MKEKFSLLWAFISNQEKIIGALYDKITGIVPDNEDKLVHAAFLLHNLYSAYEEIFKEISFAFENQIQGRSDYHKNLLIRMKMDLPGIRPKLLGEQGYLIFMELMGFRHVFRHAYNFDIAADKLESIRTRIINNRAVIDEDFERFKGFLLEHLS